MLKVLLIALFTYQVNSLKPWKKIDFILINPFNKFVNFLT